MSAPAKTTIDQDAIEEAVAAAYAASGLVPGGIGAVAPLRRLVAAHGLIVDEVPGLTRVIGTHHLRARAGQTVVARAVDDEGLAGFLYANAAGGWVLVNAADPLARRRFSIAHEIGHFRLHFMPLLAEAAEVEFREELTMPGDETALASSQGTAAYTAADQAVSLSAAGLVRMEEEADRFAAALLMPASVVRGLVALHGDRCGGKRSMLARRLATDCLVSQTAMRQRLADLEIGLADGREGG